MRQIVLLLNFFLISFSSSPSSPSYVTCQLHLISRARCAAFHAGAMLVRVAACMADHAAASTEPPERPAVPVQQKQKCRSCRMTRTRGRDDPRDGLGGVPGRVGVVLPPRDPRPHDPALRCFVPVALRRPTVAIVVAVPADQNQAQAKRDVNRTYPRAASINQHPISPGTE